MPVEPGPSDLAARLRRARPALWGRVTDDRVILDIRTVLPERDQDVINVLRTGPDRLVVRVRSGCGCP